MVNKYKLKSNIEQLKSRGYVEDSDFVRYKDCNKEELLKMLNSNVAIERTISATFLSKYKEVAIIYSLLNQLENERKLYTKIALTETLASYGELSCEILVDYLGLIGNNQYKMLPNKKFNKSNYPLPRDIVARTIIKMGDVAIPFLIKCLESNDEIKILEALDAYGFISYYESNKNIDTIIFEMFNKYENNDLKIWKLISVMQAFDSEKAISILKKYSNSDIYQHKIEAIRSLKQIKNRERRTRRL